MPLSGAAGAVRQGDASDITAPGNENPTRPGVTVQRRISLWASLIVLFGLAVTSTALAAPTPTTTNPLAHGQLGRIYTVHGVVVHRAPLLGRYVLVNRRGDVLAIATQGRMPAFGHKITARIQRVGYTWQQLSVSVGASVSSVVLHGVVTDVSPLGKRFTVSDGLASILIHHRLARVLPNLLDRVTLRAHINARGRLVERKLVDHGFKSGDVTIVGTLRDVIPPTPDTVETTTEQLPAGACANGCEAISGDDSAESTDLVLVPLPAAAPPASNDLTVGAAAFDPYLSGFLSAVEGLAGAITSEAMIDETQAPPAIPTGPVIVPIGTITIEYTPSPSPAPTVLPASTPTCPTGQTYTYPADACECPPGDTADGASCLPPITNQYIPIQLPPPPVSDDCLNGSLLDKIVAYAEGPYGCLAGSDPSHDFPTPEVPPAWEAF